MSSKRARAFGGVCECDDELPLFVKRPCLPPFSVSDFLADIHHISKNSNPFSVVNDFLAEEVHPCVCETTVFEYLTDATLLKERRLYAEWEDFFPFTRLALTLCPDRPGGIHVDSLDDGLIEGKEYGCYLIDENLHFLVYTRPRVKDYIGDLRCWVWLSTAWYEYTWDYVHSIRPRFYVSCMSDMSD